MSTCCVLCRRPFPLLVADPVCPCGGVPAAPEPAPYDPRVDAHADHRAAGGVWRHAAALGLPARTRRTPTAGEGRLRLDPFGFAEAPPGVLLARGDLEPFGTIRAAGACLLAGALSSAGPRTLDAGTDTDHALALAGYCRGTPLTVRATLPAAASLGRRGLLERGGVRLGPARPAGALDASAARQPLGAAGATALAWGLVESLGRQPALVVTPALDGTLLAGLAAGFRSAERAGAGPRPRLVGVQDARCAPLADAFSRGRTRVDGAAAPDGAEACDAPLARQPVRDVEALAAARESGGTIDAVDALAGERAVRILWRLGVKVEPWAALPVAWLIGARGRALAEGNGPVVALATAAGERDGIPLVEDFP